jgi:hypothetical protein
MNALVCTRETLYAYIVLVHTKKKYNHTSLHIYTHKYLYARTYA